LADAAGPAFHLASVHLASVAAMLQSLQAFTPTVAQAWALLALAIGFEVVGTSSMKLSHGFTNLWPTVTMFSCYAIAFGCNTVVVKTLDISVTYAVWSGVGTALVALIGMLWFKEPASVLKLICIGLIVIGVFGLNTASRMPQTA
jgi:small multidrug resistance pump